MIMRFAAALAGLLLLTGCTDSDWDHAMSFAGFDEPPPPAAPAPAPVRPLADAQASGASDAFCRSVAAQDAGANGFDSQTQSRVYAQSYRQCLEVFGPGR